MKLTPLMQRYRACLKLIWNSYFADHANWDERDHFYDAAVSLFRGLVLYPLELEQCIVLPSYRGDRAPIFSILLKVKDRPSVRWSCHWDWSGVSYLDADTDFSKFDIRYVDLFDFYELGPREFEFVAAQIIAEPSGALIGAYLLIPFDNVFFEIVSDKVSHISRPVSNE